MQPLNDRSTEDRLLLYGLPLVGWPTLRRPPPKHTCPDGSRDSIQMHIKARQYPILVRKNSHWVKSA